MSQRNPKREQYNGHQLLIVEEWNRPNYAPGHGFQIPEKNMGYSAYIDGSDQGNGIVSGVSSADEVMQRLRERVDEGDIW